MSTVFRDGLTSDCSRVNKNPPGLSVAKICSSSLSSSKTPDPTINNTD